jgi:type IV pilus assembly protein PilX
MLISYHANRQKSVICSKQKGVVLIIALVMLLIMTVAGVTTMTGATLQERIAGNQRQQMIARGNADRALKAAEAVLDALHAGGSFESNEVQARFSAVNDGLYMAVSLGSGMAAQPLDNLFDRQNIVDWNSAANANNSAPITDGGNTIGRFIIEYMGSENFDHDKFDSGSTYDGSEHGGGPNDGNGTNNNRGVFRITAMGAAGNGGNVATILESYYLEAAK